MPTPVYQKSHSPAYLAGANSGFGNSHSNAPNPTPTPTYGTNPTPTPSPVCPTPICSTPAPTCPAPSPICVTPSPVCPTPTPSQAATTQSSTPTSGMQNGIWVENPSSITPANLAKLVNAKIFNVFILVGEWRAATHTIDYSTRGGTNSQMVSLIQTIKNYDSRFKVYAWVCWDLSTSNKVDLSQSSYRSTMYSQVLLV